MKRQIKRNVWEEFSCRRRTRKLWVIYHENKEKVFHFFPFRLCWNLFSSFFIIFIVGGDEKGKSRNFLPLAFPNVFLFFHFSSLLWRQDANEKLSLLLSFFFIEKCLQAFSSLLSERELNFSLYFHLHSLSKNLKSRFKKIKEIAEKSLKLCFFHNVVVIVNRMTWGSKAFVTFSETDNSNANDQFQVSKAAETHKNFRYLSVLRDSGKGQKNLLQKKLQELDYI